jgi:hypothetical protein
MIINHILLILFHHTVFGQNANEAQDDNSDESDHNLGSDYLNSSLSNHS